MATHGRTGAGTAGDHRRRHQWQGLHRRHAGRHWPACGQLYLAAVEKAGIAREGRPVIVGELDPPAGLLEALQRIGAKVQRAGVDFTVERLTEGGWRWRHRDGTTLTLPDPALAAPVQYANAASAIAALHALEPGRDLHAAASASLRSARVRGAVAELRH